MPPPPPPPPSPRLPCPEPHAPRAHPLVVAAVAHALHLHQELGFDAPRRLALAVAARAAQRVNLAGQPGGCGRWVFGRACSRPGCTRQGPACLPASLALTSRPPSAPPPPLAHQPSAQLTSSMKMMAGDFSRASANRLLTSFSDSPSHLDTRSEEETEKKVESASVATACAHTRGGS